MYVEKIRDISCNLPIVPQILVVSHSELYEDFCNKNKLFFMQKSEPFNPKAIMQWIDLLLPTLFSNTPKNISVEPLDSKQSRIESKLKAIFDDLGLSANFSGREYLLKVIPRWIELRANNANSSLNEVYNTKLR